MKIQQILPYTYTPRSFIADNTSALTQNLNTDSISFSGRDCIEYDSSIKKATPCKAAWKSHLVRDLRDIPDLPCAICGKIMIPNRIYKEFDPDKPDRPSKDVFKILKPYENLIEGYSKVLYNKMKEYSQDNPDLTIKQILSKEDIHQPYLEDLERKQFGVLNWIKKNKSRFSNETQFKIDRALKNAEYIIKDENKEDNKKRGRIVRKFKAIECKPSEQTEFEAILNKLDELPYAGNDESAFIVKYAKRSSNETLQVILQPYCATNEHVIPHHNFNDRTNGKSIPSNYIILHQHCNSKRQRQDYGELVKENPQITLNMQKYLNRIIEFLSTGKLASKYDFYPLQIKRTMESNEVSDGLIHLDTSKYKRPFIIYNGDCNKLKTCQNTKKSR